MVQTYLYIEDLGVDHIGIEAAKQEVYRIDKEVTQAVLNAERQVANRNYEYGGRWSPTLANKAGRTVTFWRNCTRLRREGNDPAVMMLEAHQTEFGLSTPHLSFQF